MKYTIDPAYQFRPIEVKVMLESREDLKAFARCMGHMPPGREYLDFYQALNAIVERFK